MREKRWLSGICLAAASLAANPMQSVLGPADRILYAAKGEELPLAILDGEGKGLKPAGATAIEGILQIRPGEAGKALLLDQKGVVLEVDRDGKEVSSLDLARLKGATGIHFTSVAPLPGGDLLVAGARLGEKRPDARNPGMGRAKVEKGIVAQVSRARGGEIVRVREFVFAVRAARPAGKEGKFLVVTADALDEVLVRGGSVMIGGGKRLLLAGWEEGPDPVYARHQVILFDAEPLPDGGWAAAASDLSGGNGTQSKLLRLDAKGREVWSAPLEEIMGRSVQALRDGRILVLGGG